jgi:hypothetical protein
MTPHDRLKQRVEQLIDQGCTPDTALQRALRERNKTTIEQSELLDLKHQIQLDMELEEGGEEGKKE